MLTEEEMLWVVAKGRSGRCSILVHVVLPVVLVHLYEMAWCCLASCRLPRLL